MVAAHTDDELLGLGGTVRWLANAGKEIHAVILAEGITSRYEKREETDQNELRQLKEDAQRAAAIVGYQSIEFCGSPDNRMDIVDFLDIIKVVSKYVKKYNPDTIFTHHYGDKNIDHRHICEAVLTACRPIKGGGSEKNICFRNPEQYRIVSNDL